MTAQDIIIIVQWGIVAVLTWGWAREHAKHRDLKRLVDDTTANILGCEPLGRTPHSDPDAELLAATKAERRFTENAIEMQKRVTPAGTPYHIATIDNPIDEAAKAGYRVGDDHER